jgi:hypothetical protein
LFTADSESKQVIFFPNPLIAIVEPILPFGNDTGNDIGTGNDTGYDTDNDTGNDTGNGNDTEQGQTEKK